jgi:hypothetical protein
MFATAMIGPTKGVLERQVPLKLTRMLRGQLSERSDAFIKQRPRIRLCRSARRRPLGAGAQRLGG